MQMRLLLSAALLSLASAPLRAQNEPGRDFQFADPDKFFQQLFGRQIEQDQAALAGVDVTAAEEQQYGDRAAQAFIQKLRSRNIPISWKGQDVAYVKQLVQVIHPQMQNHDRYRTFKVFVVESDETDAFAFPVGTLFVFRGMLSYSPVSRRSLRGDNGTVQQTSGFRTARQTIQGSPKSAPAGDADRARIP